jgi:hypothetical protein
MDKPVGVLSEKRNGKRQSKNTAAKQSMPHLRVAVAVSTTAAAPAALQKPEECITGRFCGASGQTAGRRIFLLQCY